MEEKAAPDRGLWERVVGARGPALPALALGAHLLLVLWVNADVLRDFPNSADEYSYVVSAQLFAEGRLSVPSPEPRESFDFIHVVNDGKYYGKYPPGWPALLSLGILLGAPWAVNAVLSLATLAVLYVAARRLYSVETANLAMLLGAANPFLVFNAASYFSHTACLFFVTAFLAAALLWAERPGSRLLPLLAGASAGASFLIRPYTTLVLLAPALGYAAWKVWTAGRRREAFAGLALGALPALVGLGLYLAYNHAQTGSPWLAPFTRYDPTDGPNFSRVDKVPWRFRTLVLGRLFTLTQWLALTPLFAGLALFRPAFRAQRHTLLLAGLPILLVAAHFFYRATGGNQYGPRYLFEASTCLLLVGAFLIAAYGRPGFFMLAGALLLNATTFRGAVRHHGEQVRERMEVYDRVAEEGLANAMVFLRTGSGTMPAGDLTRNGTRFDGPVLYVLDRGIDNDALLARHPGRSAWVYEYDKKTGHGRLSPLEDLSVPAVPARGPR